MGEAELIGALKQGGPWAVVVGVMWILWRRDSNQYITTLIGVIERNTEIITKLSEKIDQFMDRERR